MLIYPDESRLVRIRNAKVGSSILLLAVAALGRAKIKVSLGTKDQKEAHLRYVGAMRRIYDQIETAVKGGPLPVGRRTVPVAQLQPMKLDCAAPRWRAQ